MKRAWANFAGTTFAGTAASARQPTSRRGLSLIRSGPSASSQNLAEAPTATAPCGVYCRHWQT